MNSIQTKKNINITAKPLLAELLRSQAEKAAPKTYPIKDFLLSRSYLVKYNEKETSGKQLTEVEKIKAYRIYEKRDETMFKIRNYLAKYYRAVINGNYSIDGMPEIEQGIKGWIENKIWKLLVSIGEPNHQRFKKTPADYWEEA